MKERPVLFSGPMVLALLAGRKTQTRRLFKRRPGWTWSDGTPLCPYGDVGDRLWVRETWASTNPEHPRVRVAYKADNTSYGIADVSNWDTGQSFPNAKLFPEVHHPDGPAGKIKRWTPSIHMPRWASRLDLEVTARRTERLQDISEADAQAEGVERCQRGCSEPSHRCSFIALWKHLNEQRATWASNPLVWVVTFQRLPAFAQRDCA